MRFAIGCFEYNGQFPVWQHARRAHHLSERPDPVFRQRGSAIEMGHWAAPAAHLAVVRHQAVTHGLLRHNLQSRVKAGPHHQPALGCDIGAELRDELPPHIFSEPVGAGDRLRPVEFGRDDRFGFRRLGLSCRDRMIFHHAIQYPVAPTLREIRVLEWIVVVGRLW